VESKCFKNMEAFKAVMKKHNINLDSSSSSHGYALSASGFSFNATSNSSFYEWLIDSGEFYHMVKDKAIFLLLMNATPNKYLLVMIDLLVL
jgi:hypothetical protein